MNFMRLKNFSKYIFLVCIIFVITFSLTGCGKKDEEEGLKSKSKSQMEYIESKIITMLNDLNSIQSQNYSVDTKKVEMSGNKGSEASGKNSGESSGSGSSGGGSGESSSGGSGSSGSSSSGGSGSSGGSSGQGESTKITAYEMKSHGILTSDKSNIDWGNIKKDIEGLYETWNIVILDLYKLNINNEQILAFSEELDKATSNIKAEDKVQTGYSLARLYSNIPKYVETYSGDDAKNNILYTRSHVLNAYTFVSESKWNEVTAEINEAVNSFTKVVNNLDYVGKNEYNVSKTYVTIKELQSSLNSKDSDLFYIKYKNVMKELQNLK